MTKKILNWVLETFETFQTVKMIPNVKMLKNLLPDIAIYYVFFMIMSSCNSFTARMEDKANGSVDSKRYPLITTVMLSL